MAEINFSIDRGRFKGLSLTAKKSERLAYFDAHDLTAQERLLYQVWASPSLKTRVFTGGQLVLSAGEVLQLLEDKGLVSLCVPLQIAT